MDLQAVTEFFMWCSIINFLLLLFSTFMLANIPGFVYKFHKRYFHITKEKFVVAAYGYLATFKLLFIFFNLVPFCALLLVGG